MPINIMLYSHPQANICYKVKGKAGLEWSGAKNTISKNHTLENKWSWIGTTGFSLLFPVCRLFTAQ